MLFESARELLQRLSGGAAVADGLVVHVREVHHSIDLEPARLQVPLQQVLEDVGAEIPDVRVVIDSRPQVYIFTSGGAMGAKSSSVRE